MVKPRILERHIENDLVRRVQKIGGRAPKYKTPARPAAPDRILLFHPGIAAFCECKRPGEEPTKCQYTELQKLADMGFMTFWSSSYERNIQIIETLKTEFFL